MGARLFVSLCAIGRPSRGVFFVVSARTASVRRGSVRRDLVGLGGEQRAVAQQVLSEQEHGQHQHHTNYLIALQPPHHGERDASAASAAMPTDRRLTASLPVSTLLFT